MKKALGYNATTSGIISTRKSIPFLIVNLEIHTILIVFKGKRKLGLGENLFVSTAFGIVKQI